MTHSKYFYTVKYEKKIENFNQKPSSRRSNFIQNGKQSNKLIIPLAHSNDERSLNKNNFHRASEKKMDNKNESLCGTILSNRLNALIIFRKKCNKTMGHDVH